MVVLASGSTLAQNYEVNDAGGEVLITTPSYELGVARNGLGYYLSKAGTTVLGMPPVSLFPVSEGGKQRAEKARSSGEPLIAPLWYHALDGTQTPPITDQFMLRSGVLVAPVLQKGDLSRDIYLPAGSWLDFRTGAKVQGGNWIRGYPAPLDVLPVFTRDGFKALEETAE